MKKTAAIDPPNEPCVDVAPAPRFDAPAQLVQPDSEARLIEPLRVAVRTLSPTELLMRAAAAFYWAAHPSPPPAPQGSVALGKALSDLAVTGRVAYGRFKATPPNEASLVAAVRAGPGSPGQAVPGDVDNAVSMALDRAYAVAWTLRGPIAPQPAARTPLAWAAARKSSLNWIAVSGEDDTPHRPVNVAPPEFQQFEIPVTVPGRRLSQDGVVLPTVTVQTRFFIASAVEDLTPAIVPQTRALPPDPVPHIPDGHQVILFLHGHSSSAEEAGPIIPHIHQAGLDRGTKYSIVSLDLPNNGYSEMFDHEKVAKSDRTSWPGAPTDHGPILTPILDFIEDFVVAFVDALDGITPIKSRFAGVIGGSLGGNLGLILGRRPLAANPWLNAAIVSWSPASVWPPKVQEPLGQGLGPFHCVFLWKQSEQPNSRVLYFQEAYDKPLPGVKHRPPELWYSDDWLPCKKFHIVDSRVARQEIYNASFRQWHWRLAGEQLIYSHDDHVYHGNKNTQWRFERNTVRMLLVAGQKDDYTYAKIYSCTQSLAEKMVDTPGTSLFLNDTGHSIHIERPRYFAGEIVKFLSTTLPELKTTDISFLTPLLLSGPG